MGLAGGRWSLEVGHDGTRHQGSGPGAVSWGLCCGRGWRLHLHLCGWLQGPGQGLRWWGWWGQLQFLLLESNQVLLKIQMILVCFLSWQAHLCKSGSLCLSSFMLLKRHVAFIFKRSTCFKDAGVFTNKGRIHNVFKTSVSLCPLFEYLFKFNVFFVSLEIQFAA